MERKTIALEEGLGRFRQSLEEAGFSTRQVSRFEENDWGDADLVMVSGQNDNLMGIQTVRTPVPVINVEGLTVEEIVELAKRSLG